MSIPTNDKKITLAEGVYYTLDGAGNRLFKRPEANGFSTLYYRSAASNCKIGYMDYLGSWLGMGKEDWDKNKKYFDTVLQAISRYGVFIHILSEPFWNWLKENYDYYYAITAPLGYSGKQQYHILLKAMKNTDVYPAPNWKAIEASKGKSKNKQILDIINSKPQFKRSKLAAELIRAFELE